MKNYKKFYRITIFNFNFFCEIDNMSEEKQGKIEKKKKEERRDEAR